jgi:hypothetical protein
MSKLKLWAEGIKILFFGNSRQMLSWQQRLWKVYELKKPPKATKF